MWCFTLSPGHYTIIKSDVIENIAAIRIRALLQQRQKSSISGLLTLGVYTIIKELSHFGERASPQPVRNPCSCRPCSHQQPESCPDKDQPENAQGCSRTWMSKAPALLVIKARK